MRGFFFRKGWYFVLLTFFTKSTVLVAMKLRPRNIFTLAYIVPGVVRAVSVHVPAVFSPQSNRN